jgi:hypothetical protein
MLAPTYSVLTDAADYPGLNNLASNPTVVSQFCNGARTPPEFASGGYQVPPGISDATIPNPVFSLSPAATVDEGNNWINIGWGPLALTNPVTGTVLGNYALAVNSPAIDFIPTSASTYSVTPSTDFFGNPRPDPAVPNRFDVGEVENQGKDTIAALQSLAGPWRSAMFQSGPPVLRKPSACRIMAEPLQRLLPWLSLRRSQDQRAQRAAPAEQL